MAAGKAVAVERRKNPALEIHWRWHNAFGVGGQRRVWRNDWAHDQFEVVDEEWFACMQKICILFSIRLIEQED